MQRRRDLMSKNVKHNKNNNTKILINKLMEKSFKGHENDILND